MNFPTYHDSIDKASGYLRLAMQLIAKYKVPPHPLNLTLWYGYVAGRDQALHSAIDELITRAEPFTDEVNQELYQRFFVQDEESILQLRDQLRTVLVDNLRQIVGMEDELSHYHHALDAFADNLTGELDLNTLRGQVSRVLKDTLDIGKSSKSLEKQLYASASEVDRLRTELEQIKEEVLTDALTGIANRRAFNEGVDKSISSGVNSKAPFCLLMADIDHFKKFNDTHGHLMGDNVIRYVAKILKHSVKGKDMVARFGGEEFTVILLDTALSGAMIVGDQIRKAVSAGQLKTKGSGKVLGRITISVGAAQFRMNDSAETLVKRADKALYLAKERGRDRVEQLD